MENGTAVQWVNTTEWDWILVLRTIFAAAGVAGNALVIAVYAQRRRREGASATNALIVNLAVADLLTSLLLLPVPTFRAVPLTAGGRAYCKLIFSQMLMWIAIVVSILTLTLVSLERYAAVVHPHRYRRLFAGWRSRVAIAGTWLTAVALNTFNLFVYELLPDGYCHIIWSSLAVRYLIATMVFVFEYLAPAVVMVAANAATVRTLRRQARALLSGPGGSRNSPAYSQLRARQRVIETIRLVVVVFLVCWTPDQIGFFVYHMGQLPDSYLGWASYRLMVLLAFANSCANPIVYAFKNPSFRHSLLAMLGLRGGRVDSTAAAVSGAAGERDKPATASVPVQSVRPRATAPTLVPT